MVISIIKKVKEHFKESLKLLYILPAYPKILWQYKRCTQRKIVLIGTPAHGNLGDQAIAVSETEFIRNYMNDERLFEIPTPLYKTHRKFLKRHCKRNDLIIISGGGWMGNLWVHNEIMVRNIIGDYPMNQIIIFPQTLYYTDDDAGRTVLQTTKLFFQNHKKIYLAVRDRDSYNVAQGQLGLNNEHLLFCPDMVLYGTLANKNAAEEKNKTALICMRRDVEKLVNITGLESIVESMGYVAKETTTVFSHLIKIKNRKTQVSELIKQYSKAEFMITDRLHAMIFSLLAGIPCYVFNNGTGKVFGVASYLCEAGMPVKMLNNIDDVKNDVFGLIGKPYELCDELEKYFHKLGCLLTIKGDYYLESEKNDCN